MEYMDMEYGGRRATFVSLCIRMAPTSSRCYRVSTDDALPLRFSPTRYRNRLHKVVESVATTTYDRWQLQA